jgi:adenylate cyclase
MGEVYRAHDLKLDRDVALKLLPEALAGDPSALERFQREARAVAALNHPHIVTIYSVEEADGIHFLTMELIEGQSLADAVPPGGLPLARVYDIGIAMADALTAAHDKGIVHRDLKPANVMLTKDGRVKVLDFGLAKLAERAPDLSEAPTQVTQAGMLVGTVPYMSPEQVGGDPVDARTDIFSLGVVLYELSTGRRPFQGKSNAETISSIVRDAPRPVIEMRQDAPRHLGRILEHCLQKDPEARFQTAKDVRNELRALRQEVQSGTSEALPIPPARRGGKAKWIGLAAAVVVAGVVLAVVLSRDRKTAEVASAAPAVPAAPAVNPRSIAVLPLVNMSSDKEQEYFSDGISEELLNLLAKIPELKVAARTSSFSFKGKNVEIQEIARQLGVAHVLEGSVRKAGGQVRITAQLIHAADGFHLWSETYDRKLDDIFKIQDEIASEVVKQLRVTMLGGAPKAHGTDPQAYALYLQSRELGRQFTPEGFKRSNALLRQVLEIDPRYAPAWVGLGTNAVNELQSMEGMQKGREAARKALEIDPGHAPAHTLLGFIAMASSDLAASAAHTERALALDPSDPRVLGNAALVLASLGRLDESLAIQEAVVQRDPVNTTAHANLGFTQLCARRFDEALASLRTALSLSPGRTGGHTLIGYALLMKGDASAALAEVEQEPFEIYRGTALAVTYHALSRKTDSDAALAKLIADHGKDAPSNIAAVYAFRGESDKAFEWLDRAISLQDPGLSELNSDVLFTNLRSDPRWLPFLRKIGFAPEQLAKIELKVPLP